jgi:hypothetical protein
MLDPHVFSSFTSAAKEAAATPPKGLLKGIKTRDLAAAAAGAGSLYGGNRLVQDIRVGEQVRKQQRGY